MVIMENFNIRSRLWIHWPNNTICQTTELILKYPGEMGIDIFFDAYNYSLCVGTAGRQMEINMKVTFRVSQANRESHTLKSSDVSVFVSTF